MENITNQRSIVIEFTTIGRYVIVQVDGGGTFTGKDIAGTFNLCMVGNGNVEGTGTATTVFSVVEIGARPGCKFERFVVVFRIYFTWVEIETCMGC
jgi:hypothetical protein